MRRDTITGGVCLLISVALLLATRGLPEASILVPIGPGVYPRFVLALTALLSLIVLANGVRARKMPSGDDRPASGTRNCGLVIAAFAVFGLYTFVLPFAGFRISTFLFVGGLQALLDPPRTQRMLWLLLAVALATALITHFVFESNLGVLLPRGSSTGV